MRRSALAAALLCLALPAMARENHALLIGVDDYPSLDQRYWLKGPGNDVALVRTYLTTAAPVPFAPENVVVLSDAVPGATPPTLAAIRTAFADLAASVAPGDFVYLHFSGHGSQAPALNPETELDGLDELFLPADIGPWEKDVGTVQNALVDDEIGTMIDALRAKGADVWAVFDSCHSGTVTRGAPTGDDEVRTRQIPPEALGIDAETLTAAEAATTRGMPDPRARPDAPFDDRTAEPGHFVAFFAAQTNEQTPELNLPKGKPGRIPQGVFTYALFETLAEYPGATYAQIGQELLRRYAVKNLATTTPMFEGDLDAVVFSGTPAPRVAQWAATVTDAGFALPAGTLHGLAVGTRLAVMASAADDTAAALGFAEVQTADTFTATAVALAADGAALPAEWPKGLTLRKIGADLDFTLTVALPEPGTAPAAAMGGALDALRADAGPRLIFVDAGAPADLRLAVLPDSPRPDALWVLPASGLADDLARTPSIGTADKDAATLAATLGDVLGRMSKAMNLMKLGEGVGTGALPVSVALQTKSPENPALRDLPGGVPRLIPEDQVHVTARNDSDGPVDVNVLYIGSDWSITHFFSGRLQPGDTLKRGLFKITDTAFGRERVVLVISPAKPQSPVENLAFLEQDALQLTRGSFNGLETALQDAGFGTTTRGAVGLSDEEDAGPGPEILQFELQTVPAAN